MHSAHLHEHDANQGAKSSGEFLGMTGNSGWLLLGSAGATILMVVLLWGMLGVSLWFCLFVGAILCAGSVTYVFTLKNNRPEHYDSDFFESALVEAGVRQFHFGPRRTSPPNPFTAALTLDKAGDVRSRQLSPISARPRVTPTQTQTAVVASVPAAPERKRREDPTVARAAFEQVVERLAETESLLEETLAETLEGRA